MKAKARKVNGNFQSLEEHLLSVGELTSVRSKKIGTDLVGKLAGLLHDFGKYSNDFQQKLINDSTDLVDHSTAGAQYIWDHLSSKDPYLAQILAVVIASHHSGLINFYEIKDGSSKNRFLQRMKEPETRTHYNECLQKVDDLISTKINKIISSSELYDQYNDFLKKISTDNTSGVEKYFYLHLYIKFIFSCLIDGDRTDAYNFAFNQYQSQQTKYNFNVLLDVFEKNYTKKYSCVQNDIDLQKQKLTQHVIKKAHSEKGIYEMLLPTGSGKTFLGLNFALRHATFHDMEHIFYIAPYTSVIDQTVNAYQEILDVNDFKRENMILPHHSNIVRDNKTYKENYLFESWNYPIICTTLVQFFNTFFDPNTRNIRRLHQFSNSVIIIDEPQNIPIEFVHLFNNIINFLTKCCNTTVLLTTATLPDFDGKNIITAKFKENGALLTPKKLFDETVSLDLQIFKRNIIRDRTEHETTLNEVAKMVLEAGTTNSLVITNTIQQAKSLYETYKINDIENVYYLTTNLCPEHRKKILIEVRHKLKNKDSVHVISTPLIEAGVDISFQYVIRFWCGMDSIVQTAGRCNRYGEHDFKDCYVDIVKIKGENLGPLKKIKDGQNITTRILDEYKRNPVRFDNDLASVKVLQQYYMYYFNSQTENMSYNIFDSNTNLTTTALQLLSTNKNMPDKDNVFFPYAFELAAKNIDVIKEQTLGIIVPYENGKELIKEIKKQKNSKEINKMLKYCQPYVVNVQEHKIDNLLKQKIIEQINPDLEIFYLNDLFYHRHLGFIKNIDYNIDNLCV